VSDKQGVYSAISFSPILAPLFTCFNVIIIKTKVRRHQV